MRGSPPHLGELDLKGFNRQRENLVRDEPDAQPEMRASAFHELESMCGPFALSRCLT